MQNGVNKRIKIVSILVLSYFAKKLSAWISANAFLNLKTMKPTLDHIM